MAELRQKDLADEEGVIAVPNTDDDWHDMIEFLDSKSRPGYYSWRLGLVDKGNDRMARLMFTITDPNVAFEFKMRFG